MDHDLSPAESGMQRRRSSGLLARLGVLRSLLAWLAGLVQLTDEQQEQAGVHLGYRYHR